MKFLFFTDPHLKSKNPVGRIDNYKKSVLEKINEIVHIANKEKVEYVICGGDLFDSPRVGFELIGDLIDVLSQLNSKMYVVPGNHDLFGYNIKSLPYTALGLLSKMNVVEIFTRENPIIYDDFVFEAQPYYLGIDKDNKHEDYQTNFSDKYSILIPHGMLLDKPIHPSIPTTLVDELQNNVPNMILVGHYHPGFEYKNDKTIVINPGSLARIETTTSNKRIPKIVLLNWENNQMNYQYIYLKRAKPSEEVLNFDKKEEQKQEIILLNTFKQSIEDVNLEETNAISIAQDLASQENLLDLFSSLIENETEELVSINYESTNHRVYITEIEIKNFQSHEHTVISLTENTNAFVGESDSGKTSIFRAIRWVLYNEPSGSSFMRHGANKTSVTLKTNTGWSVKRYRTTSSAGGYEIISPQGEKTVFEGIGREVPVEVLNVFQMPKILINKDEYIFQYSSQLEGPFFLSLSSGDRANWLGILTGVDKIDQAFSQLNKKLLSSKNRKKEAHKQIMIYAPKLQQKRAQQKELQTKRDIFIQYLSEIEELENKKTFIEKTYKELKSLQFILEKNKSRISLLKKNLDSIIECKQELMYLHSNYSLSNKLVSLLEKTQRKINEANKIDKLKDCVSFLKSKREEISKLHDLAKFILESGKEIKHLILFTSNYDIKSQQIKNEIKQLKEQRTQILGDLCPLCNQPIVNKKHNHM
ncbi:MAG: AAA family ATPase [Ignavibacterium sp.]|nr:AAA family ATPase [Ignavibacterium sp.]